MIRCKFFFVYLEEKTILLSGFILRLNFSKMFLYSFDISERESFAYIYIFTYTLKRARYTAEKTSITN